MNDVPEGWANITLEQVGRWGTGGTPSRRRREFFGKGIPWVKSGDLPDGPIIKTEEQITQLGLQNSSAKLMPTGTISMALYGATIGKLGVMTYPAATNQACANVVPDNRLVDARYLFFYLMAERPRLVEQGQGGAQPNISQGIVRNYPFPLAPLAEQLRVVVKLEQLLGRINDCQTRLAKVPVLLKRFRQSILAAACSGQLTADWRATNNDDDGVDITSLLKEHRAFWERRESARINAAESKNHDRWKERYKPPFEPSDEATVDVPDTWALATVSHLAFLDVGPGFKSSDFASAGIRLLRGENIEPGKLRWTDTRHWPKTRLKGLEHLLIEDGEIILGLDRPVISSGLKIARAKKSDLPCLLVQRVMRFKMVDQNFTSWLFCNLRDQRFVRHISRGLTGSDLPHVTGTGVAEYVLGLPPAAERQEIVRRVEELFTLADAVEARLASAQAQVDKSAPALLYKAFSGQLVPTEAEVARQERRDYEPASVLLERVSRERDNEAARHKASLTLNKAGHRTRSARRAATSS
jgi:type I restriction enzyme S subunit